MYKDVQVLMIRWEHILESELAFRVQLEDLQRVFEDYYGFTTKPLEIPLDSPETYLRDHFSKFLKEFGIEKNLLIIYYGGHGAVDDERHLVWKCRNSNDSPFVEWYGLQQMFLRENTADTLILLDCCHSSITARSLTRNPTHLVEVLAASSFERTTRLGGDHTLTHNLVLVLEKLFDEPTTTKYLHATLVNIHKSWTPLDGRELRTTPIHFDLLSKRGSVNGIVLQRLDRTMEATSTDDVEPTAERDEKEITMSENQERRIDTIVELQHNEPLPTDNHTERDHEELARTDTKPTKMWFGLWDRFVSSTQIVERFSRREHRLRVPRMAILGTGIDFRHTWLSNQRYQIRDARNFTDDDVNDVQDTIGLGTDFTALILKLAPTLDIFVAKVVQSHALVGRSFQAVTRAIHAATELWQVDILICPFGFRKRDNQIRDAIVKAQTHGVIVFAAASNSGANADVAFPANSPGVIAVNATDGFGNPSPFNPSPRANRMNFSTLGEGAELPLSQPDVRVSGRYLSGTGMAVCVAATIFAMLLQYTTIKMQLTDDELKQLRSPQGAEAMLQLMSTPRGGYNYVAPWFLWPDEDSESNERVVQGRIRHALGLQM